MSESQELALIGCWSLDVETGLLSWSDQTYIILGVTKETYRHTVAAFYELINPDDLDKVKLWVRDCLAGNSMEELNYRISLADGRERIIGASGGLLWDDRQKPLRLTGCMQDITGRIHKEQKDQVHRQQLDRVTHLGLMSELAAFITHELNQPLSAISIFTEVSLNIIQKKNPDLINLSEILVKTQQLALKAGEITARLRDLIKPQAQPNSSADLNTLIQNAVDLCFSDLKKHSIRLTLGLADNLPPLCVDPIQIEQVLINLISNSIDALQNLPTTLKRQLSIQTQLINRGVEVRVKDNGLGIDQEHQAKILTPFYTTKSMGMGMGLPISRSLIEAHAGKLYFNSQPGKGTTFYFSLPFQTRTEEQEKTVRSVYLYPNNHFSSLKNDLLNGEIFNQKQTVNSIDEVVEQSGASFTEEIGPLESLAGEKPTIEKLLADLAELLSNDRFISDQLLSQLKSLLPEDQQQDYQCLCQFIHNTDYPNAQLLLKTRMGFSLEPVGRIVHNPRPIILVVDDMRVHQETMTTLLSIEYQVKVAGNGPRALEICQCTPLPELILLDVNMPLMNGYEAYRKLQENLIAWDVPVIFVTAATYEESEMQGLQLGAVDYITKPINPAILLLRIGNLMRLKQQEKELKRLAQYDTLTGIPNRVLLKDRIKQAIAQANRHQNMLCVCYLDLDGFKLINDTLGHKAGDHVLVEMTQRIGHILREADTIARIGGDEFVVLLPDLNHSNEYTATVKRILESIALPIHIKDQSYYLTASMGINIYPDDKNDWEVLLLHADQAMYFAKQSGKNRYHLYNARHVY